ncbi:PD-(D/E)XK nuclease family protein [Bizionia argentinensis JUB59]|uniref:PD-(D/E)XK nuclease family protein n=1 Tax=Bizionia argentinensis JUB59 TaxID=1046627 RepID=G2EEM0_9FLAO|nr:PD-(D/E)XK nuclease family protein [Bizionia argentinensis]EGV43133.1 PD-(D/E)XK nuclease family protein [Bizionia argentinensis JUB59]
MTTFIQDVLQDLQKKQVDIANSTLILPSKRAGVFLKHQLAATLQQPIFSPTIISIEEFVEELSQLKAISNTELLFEFYDTYLDIQKNEKPDSFDAFSKWAQILLQDFNEIDRYLIPQEQIFDYLSDIKELDHWSVDTNQTDFVKNYLVFWKKLKLYYNQFSKNLIHKKKGYQGLIYREAVEGIQNYISSNPDKHHVFLGFNALNKAEETIIQELLENSHADIYWDIDASFFENKNHDAGLFIRQHNKQWPYFKNNPLNWIANNYKSTKDISVIGVPKNVGQAKCIGNILNKLQKENNSLNNTAVVLGEESLLLPVLNSIPDSIKALNITMGLPLKSIPLAALFEQLFFIHKKETSAYYFKDVIKLLSHQFISPLLQSGTNNDMQKVVNIIESNNLIYISLARLIELAPKHAELFQLLFGNWNNHATTALVHCQSLIMKIKAHLEQNKNQNLLALEHLFKFNSLFNELTLLDSNFKHLKDIHSLFTVYKELLSSETLDFKGEPLEGLQIMGMLESRVLDFETVIISSVNEGILPSGKTNNSFIPYDVKLENKLPTYKEKDAVYTYHFYRLLQRAKRVFIIYNTEIDALKGGEKSRFITQLELEGIHKIKQTIAVPDIPSETHLKETVINKNDDVINQIKKYASKGFSPSALTSYIRNPIDFYFQKVLKIKEHDDVEETVAANTLGTVIHNTLEDFYKPFEGKVIIWEQVTEMKSKIDATVTKHFKDLYKEGDISKGKNLIVFEIAKRYISNFLNLEIADLKDGNTLEIIAIELDNTAEIHIPELDFPVRITGKVDRVDKRNGITRIIDYKSGRVDDSKVQITNWDDLTTDYDKYSKSFQVLTYAFLMNAETPFNESVEAGIISFKNLNAGFIKFHKKEVGSRNKSAEITQEILTDYETELKKLILEICDQKIDFLEKKII